MKNITIIILLFFVALLHTVEFDIDKFSRPDKYGWENHDKQLEARNERFEKQKLLQIYNMRKQKYSTNILKSAIAPGWAHFVSDQPTKGLILLSSEIVFLSTSYYFFDQAMDSYDKYKESNYIADIRQYYNDANAPYKYAQLFFSLAVSIWTYTLYDSFTVTDDYNRTLWKQIIQEEKERKLQITPTGISYKF